MKKYRVTILITAIITLLNSEAFTQVFRTGDNLRIREDEIVEHDLYFGCEDLEIEGRVIGDVAVGCKDFVVAGAIGKNLYFGCRNADIESIIKGDVIGFAEEIVVSGEIRSGFRGGCSELKILGKVTGDILVGARTVYIGKDAIVEGDIYIGAEELLIEGEVTGNITGHLEEFELAGTVGKNISITVKHINFERSAMVGGNFEYKSHKETQGDLESYVTGSVFFEGIEEDDEECCETSWVFRIFLLIAALVTGIVLSVVFKTRLRENFENFSDNPGKFILIGFIAFAAIPVAIVLSMVLVFTIPLGLIVSALYFAALYFGFIIGGIYLGKIIFQLLDYKNASIYHEAIVGIVAICFLGFIPILGFLFIFTSMLAGLGILLPMIYSAFKVE